MSYFWTILLLGRSPNSIAAAPLNPLMEINPRIAELKKMFEDRNQGSCKNKKLHCEFKLSIKMYSNRDIQCPKPCFILPLKVIFVFSWIRIARKPVAYHFVCICNSIGIWDGVFVVFSQTSKKRPIISYYVVVILIYNMIYSIISF